MKDIRNLEKLKLNGKERQNTEREREREGRERTSIFTDLVRERERQTDRHSD
jgi:hypothetical protein